MKVLLPFLILILVQSLFAQQPTEIPISLKTPDGKFIGQVSGGGLDATANAVSPKQTFYLIDLNGGKIADGDQIKIRMDASQWHEDKEKNIIHRVAIKGAKEDECTFKLRIKEKLIYFETPGGKFVKVDDIAVITTVDAKNATLFDAQVVTPATASTDYTLSFKFKNGNYLGMVANGGMDASSKEITPKQIFLMVDLNGGELANGDEVKILFGEGQTQSQLRLDVEKNLIHRIPLRGAKDDGCIFKIFSTPQGVLLQTANGKYLAIASDGKSLITTDKKDETSFLATIQSQSTPK
ncbi:MAG TPA: hypothetical protein PKY82_24190 [Pyrinomonadaceae bacterium]|nr:hypothetical protein [Pyrinomonadaceae bacterium]